MEAGIFTVSELNRAVKEYLEGTRAFKNIYIQGEISNITYYKSGHLYFTLKDNKSSVKCAVFRYMIKGVPTDLKEGDRVKLLGSATLYEQGGSFQVIGEHLEKQNKLGELYEKFEKLKKYYFELGYFNEEIKKKLPKVPLNIGVVTAETGAAIRDIINTVHKRFRNVNIYLYPSRVQGEGAAYEVARGIEVFNRENVRERLELDFIIIGRGGGGIEDLWAFNEEPVIEAVYKSDLPVISAVGHEIDNLLSDLTADIRAATPTQAIEISVPLKSDLIQELEYRKNILNKHLMNEIALMKNNLEKRKSNYIIRNFLNILIEKKMMMIDKENRLNKSLKYKITVSSEKLAVIRKLLSKIKLEDKIKERKEELSGMKKILTKLVTEKIKEYKNNLEYKKAVTAKYNSGEILKQGYTLTKYKGKLIVKKESLKKDDEIITVFSDGEIKSIVR
ncbi:MAG: exodeoxyribonuclease VII large subunit [Fusobacteriales bacterium]|jgi:exodeoxyribonuclease VII large subunit|nr:exodeoxyribonuclease VII large subunit [Fusobacteriales bacterium]